MDKLKADREGVCLDSSACCAAIRHVPGRVLRKPFLVGLMLVLTVSCTIAASSAQFSMLLGARMTGALAHGAFWAMIGSIGAQLVPARQVGLATSIIFGGVSVASVLGVPLANLLAQLYG